MICSILRIPHPSLSSIKHVIQLCKQHWEPKSWKQSKMLILKPKKQRWKKAYSAMPTRERYLCWLEIIKEKYSQPYDCTWDLNKTMAFCKTTTASQKNLSKVRHLPLHTVLASLNNRRYMTQNQRSVQPRTQDNILHLLVSAILFLHRAPQALVGSEQIPDPKRLCDLLL